VVYDFSQGRSFVDSEALDQWFAEFVRRYPKPAGEGRELDPEKLGAVQNRFRVTEQERFEIPLRLSPEFYTEYALTETNVASAIRGGVPARAIREWCTASLEPVFGGRDREVVFRGYFAILRHFVRV
jgi:hypothetical protein